MDMHSEELCFNDINLDNIPRCPNCNLISLLKLNYKEGKPIINYSFENDHNGNISLEEYLQKYNTNSLTKQDCGECKKKQNEIKGDFLFCSQYNKFLCNNKNLCAYCKIDHSSHDLLELSEFNYSVESKNKLEEIIKNLEKKIKDLDTIKQDIILKINKLKKSCEYEMKLFKILISAFKYEEKQKNLNYNIIQNLKNFEDIFVSGKAQIYDKIYKEGIKFISFLPKY